jgi:hypothetical protein
MKAISDLVGRSFGGKKPWEEHPKEVPSDGKMITSRQVRFKNCDVQVLEAPGEESRLATDT